MHNFIRGMPASDLDSGIIKDNNKRPNQMSELKITISQLEDLLDRQRQSICDHIIHNIQPYSTTSEGNDTYTDIQIEEACREARYPNDFVILKRYVK